MKDRSPFTHEELQALLEVERRTTENSITLGDRRGKSKDKAYVDHAPATKRGKNWWQFWGR